MNTAICIVNYRMGERTDALVEHIEKTTKCRHEFFIVDAVDDLHPPFYRSKYATAILDYNPQMNAGLMLAVKQAHEREQVIHEKFFAYWFITTSMSFLNVDTQDTLDNLLSVLCYQSDAVIVSPALDKSSGTAWTNMKVKRGNEWRQTHGCDCLATVYRADWFDAQGGYNPDLTIGWGMDMEMSWKARQQHRTIWINEYVQMHKEESVAYAMGRWNFTPEERRVKGREEMYQVLTAKYGENFIEKLMWEGVPPQMERL